ncbi:MULTISPECIES: hypothetical protein [unclassified Kitasatospora]|nr:hypothetical protein [Kitasatospora sp. MAP12-44]
MTPSMTQRVLDREVGYQLQDQQTQDAALAALRVAAATFAGLDR